ncbi:MAG: LamG-like jellyroll fold domain-containing protein [Limisphaerales bacterium]
MSIYTNGTLCASKFGMTPFVRGNYELRIGAGNYNGRLDEFRIWNIARSQAQILANLNTPLTGNETNLLLYYRFDDNGGNPAANSAIAIGAAYNGTIVNNPILLNADEPFSTGGSAGSLAYTFTTLAGLSTSGSSDGVGNDARFSGPTGVAVDTNRNVYVADTLNHTIRKITPAGVVTTIAGLAGSAGYVEGSRENARFNHPGGVAVDNYGNVYVGDYYNRAIRKIATNGVVSTLAYAYQIPTYYFANQYLAVNGTGTTIYSEDGYSIIKLTLTGTNWVKTTLAGNAGIQAFADGTGANARFLNPAGLTVDQAGNVYVSDTSATPPNPTSYIRKITPSGVVTTIAGGGDGINLNGDGMGTNARINYPIGIAVDQFTNLYVGDGSAEIIRKITPVGTNWAVSTFAGRYNITGTITSSYSGVGTNAQFGFLLGMAVDGSGNIYAVDTAFNNVNKITSAGLVSAIAGPGDTPGFRDGTGSQARFNYPSSITLDSSGNLYVADRLNHVVRKISSVGQVITLAGQPGVAGEQDGVGNLALFSGPRGVVCDHSGNLFVTDSTSNKIRKITPAGEVTTIAGSGSAGYLDGSGTNAHFSYPAGIAIDNAGNLFVADEDNDVIRMIAPDGTVSTVAGSPIPHTGDFFFEGIYFNNGVPDGGYRDGIGTSALFNHPSGIAVDSAGNLYVADTGNIVIRKISPLQTPIVAGAANWVVTTLAGVAGVNGADDGTGEDATFGWAFPNLTTPGVTGITVDSSGNLYVTDDSNNTIRKITPAGVVTTLAGLPGILNFGGTDGTGEDARFSAPYAITVDSAGTLYVVDELNNTIRKGTFTQFGAANFTPFVPPAMNSQLRVTMLPSEASGQWRFPWEVAWRNSGQMASNLVAGNYVVEFRTVSGWLAIPASLTVVVTNNVSITNQYYPTLTTVDTNSGGSLTITLGLNPPPGAGWRFLGDTTSFYPSGYTTNLVAGTYLIEFAAVSGRTKPANASVQILPGQPTYLAENYLLAQSAPGGALLPFPVPVNQINDVNNYPFGFNGQLQSDTGYGSGVAGGSQRRSDGGACGL